MLRHPLRERSRNVWTDMMIFGIISRMATAIRRISNDIRGLWWKIGNWRKNCRSFWMDHYQSGVEHRKNRKKLAKSVENMPQSQLKL